MDISVLRRLVFECRPESKLYHSFGLTGVERLSTNHGTTPSIRFSEALQHELAEESKCDYALHSRADTLQRWLRAFMPTGNFSTRHQAEMLKDTKRLRAFSSLKELRAFR